MEPIFENRTDAGRALAMRLQGYARRDELVVLGLPRGGVPVAHEVAMALGAPLDVFVVRKLGVPGHEELAMGAIASGDVRILNEDTVSSLGISEEAIASVASQEERNLERLEASFRGDRLLPDLEGRCVILVDDGLATGATMRAAVLAVRAKRPSSVVVAVPVAPSEVAAELAQVADEVVCLATPRPFQAVGAWYLHFEPVSDEMVQRYLASAA